MLNIIEEPGNIKQTESITQPSSPFQSDSLLNTASMSSCNNNCPPCSTKGLLIKFELSFYIHSIKTQYYISITLTGMSIETSNVDKVSCTSSQAKTRKETKEETSTWYKDLTPEQKEDCSN
jgi:hypothetical protein